jgi:hypothetical protein
MIELTEWNLKRNYCGDTSHVKNFRVPFDLWHELKSDKINLENPHKVSTNLHNIFPWVSKTRKGKKLINLAFTYGRCCCCLLAFNILNVCTHTHTHTKERHRERPEEFIGMKNY